MLTCISPRSWAQDGSAPVWIEKARLAAAAKQHDSVIYYADQAMTIGQKTRDTLALLRAMRMKGKSLLALKKEKASAETFFAALRLCRSPAFEKELGILYGELGYYYYSQGQGQKAKEYYHHHIDILSRIQGMDSMGNAFINLSVTHQMLAEYDSARILLNKVGEIVARTNDSSMKAYYLLNMGAYHTVTGRLDSAKICYLQAYDLWKALGNVSQLFRVTFNLGFYAFQNKDYKEAIKYYLLSEEAAGRYGQKRELAHVYGTMAESYAALGDHKTAYKYLHLYATLNDSFAHEDINNYALQLDKQYQSEKARATIQAQQLELKQQQNTMLIIIIIAIVVVALGIGAFAYITFRNRVRKKVDEAKGRFFANVAHEIRTPLSMIKGPVEVLQNTITDKAMLHQLDIAARNTERLNDLMDQMLDISKIDAARYALQVHVGDMGALVQQLFQHHRQQAAAKRITLTCECDAHIQASFDGDAWEKILSNLVGNAIKYTPEGGTAGIEVASVQHEDAVALTINVWDSGPGIPAAEQQKIFERFYRSRNEQTAREKGTGIGLALVKELVTLMQGTITVESAPGKGAVFTVTCLLQRAGSVQAQAIPAGENTSVILLAEDDKDILDFNTTLLRNEGYTVIPASDGSIASAAIKDTLPDIVVTDLMMPVKDGMELLREIRANEVTAHIPVIILSARAAQDTRIEGMAGGAQAYLPKPFSPAELKNTVKSQLDLLQRHKARYQAQVTNEEKAVEQRIQDTDPFTQRCHTIILEHLDDAQFSVERLAELMNVNRSHFQRKIKTLTGFSPSELIKSLRLEKAKEMLLKKEGNITETAYATGFTSQSYFTRCFTDHFGYPPSEVVNKVKG
ncbi:hypothetical protein GCM10023093_19270 [Nemorincola caseinilytica]|uniref:histidine kinase n=1 Tax=Nemorincola caseinilytica TaxID=2054315 RepID=A0ABP8NHP7_9BACT